MNTIIQRLSSIKFQSLLLLAAAIWGLGTVLVKSTVDDLPPFWLVGIRFFSAGVIFCIIFAPQIVKVIKQHRFAEHLKVSAILGISMIAGYTANTLGLTDTTAAKSSFLTGLYCIVVPFVAWIIMKKRPTVFNISAAILCLVGVGFVSLAGQDSFAISWGDAVTLLSALLLGIQVALTSKLAPGRNMLAVTAMQFFIGGGAVLILAAFIEAPPTIAALLIPETFGSIAYLVLFATCAALLLQNIGLVHVAPSSGALLLSFESVFGVLFSVLVIGESITLMMVFGFTLIFLAVVVSEWLPSSAIVKNFRRRSASAQQARRLRARRSQARGSQARGVRATQY